MSELSSQRQQYIDFKMEPLCSVCPFGFEGLCKGPTSLKSKLPVDDRFIGCFDAARLTRFYADLRRRTPLVPCPNRPELPDLPTFIPVLEDGMPKSAFFKRDVLFGVAFSTLFDDRGNLKYKDRAHLRRALNLPPDARLCLFGTCDDEKLELFWKRSEELCVWDFIKELGFEFVTTPTFSVYDSHPRSDHVNSQWRTFIAYERLIERGIPTIPFLFCFAHEDYEVAARWLSERPEISTVGFLGQMHRSDSALKEYLLRTKRLLSMVDRPMKTLVLGVASEVRLAIARDILDVSTFATGSPVLSAINGELVTERLSSVKAAKDEWKREDLMTANLEMYEQYLRERASEVGATLWDAA